MTVRIRRPFAREPPVRDYYQRREVRTRIREYASLTEPGHPGCAYLAAMTGLEGPYATWYDAPHYPPAALDRLLATGADIARSMLDREGLLVFLDLDFQDPDDPGFAFRTPAPAFGMLEPMYAAITAELLRLDMPLLPLMTGEGYHFVGRVAWSSKAISRLASLCPETPGWLSSMAPRQPPWVHPLLGEPEARAYAGLGMVMEHLGHEIQRHASVRCPVPVVMNGTVVGRAGRGRQCVSIDLTFAGDPLDMRHLRVAFGAYQRHRWRPDIFGEDLSRTAGPLVVLPRVGSLEHLLAGGRGTAAAIELASRVDATIPDVALGAERLLDDYQASPVAAAHRRFYAEPAMPREEWPARFDPHEWRELPPCISGSLIAPNDRLLQPAHVQHVVRAFLSRGWPPRHIAALIQSRYAGDFRWGDRWTRMHAPTKTEVDVRVFSTLCFLGLDRLVDFNCVSAQEKGLCPMTGCRHDLRADRHRLLERVAS
ncbi:MAG TPA: hypothetical protein VF720_00860 [Candidatus Eisenbacteria bacterium]